MLIKISESEFYQKVLNKYSPTIVEFYADWCPMCKKMQPILESIAIEYQGKINFYQLEEQDAENIGPEYNISAFPTLIFINDGKEVARTTGIRGPNTLKRDIEQFFGILALNAE